MIRQAALALAESKRSHGGAVIYSAELEPALRELDDARDEQYNRTLATALARAVDAKDSGTCSHCETVSQS